MASCAVILAFASPASMIPSYNYFENIRTSNILITLDLKHLITLLNRIFRNLFEPLVNYSINPTIAGSQNFDKDLHNYRHIYIYSNKFISTSASVYSNKICF